jgi:hypothetical protein
LEATHNLNLSPSLSPPKWDKMDKCIKNNSKQDLRHNVSMVIAKF